MKKNNNNTEDNLLLYLDNLYEKTKDTRLVDQKARLRIIKMIKDASKITKLAQSDLLNKLDFKPRDLAIEALEAFLAELRSIFWLDSFKFTDITPLQATNKNQQPDFIAKYKDKNCAIEVFCLTHKHGQQRDPRLGVFVNFTPDFGGSKFGRDFITVAQSKKQQLDLISSNIKIKILLCVVNAEVMVNLNTKNDFDKYAKLFYEKLSWGKATI